MDPTFDSSGVPQEFVNDLYAIPGNRVALRYLIEQLNQNGVAILAGYSVAGWAGYPRWDKFIVELANTAGAGEFDVIPLAADGIVDATSRMFLYDAIEETYGFLRSDPVTWRGPLSLLPYISGRVITTNRDNAIEAVYSSAGVAIQAKSTWADPAPQSLPWLWKLHGTVEDPSTLLVTTQTIKLALHDHVLHDRLGVFAQSNSLLMLGVSYQEVSRDLIPLFLPDKSDSRHYVVLTGSRDQEAVKQLSKLSIRPIWCPPYFGDEEELLLRHLISHTVPAMRPTPPRPMPPFIPRPANVTAPPEKPTVAAVPQPSASELQIPQELVDACRAGECVLFAGAGLSARAGVPTWNRFLHGLLAFAQEHHIVDPEYASSLESALKEGARDAAADGLVQAFGNQRALLHQFLHETFPEPSSLAPAHHHLRNISFATVVTTNYDRLLEGTFPEFVSGGLLTTKDAEALLDALSQRRQVILKLYGVIERPETLIFAPIEYREAVSSNVSFSKCMEGFFFSRNFFFVGLSLEGIQDFLSGFVFRGSSPRKHFALVAVSGSAWKAKADLLERRYNIQVIPFPVSETFREFDVFIENLSEAARPLAKTAGSDAEPALPTPGIRRLILEDIGPFQKLDLEFPKDKNWKILLGDNGVGKSTILKAIATAIAGSDARSYAGRLVRAGATRGRITLITEQNQTGYITDILTKDMTSEAEVVSIPGRPMEAEGWLALGFSPLRVVTWTPSLGPQAIVQKGRPSADDLVPLLSGESDPRMDRLKQWIVNLDSADKAALTQPQQELRTFKGHTDSVSSVTTSADGRTLISGSFDNTIKVWDAATGREIQTIKGHDRGVNTVTFHENTGLLVSGSYDNTIRVWHLETGHELRVLHGHSAQVLSVASNRDGTVLASGSEDKTIRWWDPQTGKQNMVLDGHAGQVNSVAFGGDGRMVASGSNDLTIHLSDANTGQLLRTLRGHRDVVSSVEFSPDGHTLASGSRDGTIKLWDIDNEGELNTFSGHNGHVTSVAFCPDGNTLASGSNDATIKLWDVKTGRCLRTFVGHTLGVRCVAFTPDGMSLVSGADDKTIKLWSLLPADAESSHLRTIRNFFNLIATLTDRKDIEFLRVTDNFRVLVKVADVKDGVPMEVLSQGLTSLFGWIGVLCQRLKETQQNPTKDPLATDAYALVLIDELDAHMHPRWQQVLVDRLKQSFPHVQFVACTHSPLIVSGMDKQEVDRFTLRKGTITKVDFDPDMTLGRTDQILTGELFDLPTTLDPATQKRIIEYEDLLGKSDRDPENEKRFRELGRMLEERIPPSPSELLERRARELLESLHAADLDALDKDPRKKVKERMAQLSKALRRQEAEEVKEAVEVNEAEKAEEVP